MDLYLGYGDAGVGQSCLPFPFVGLGLVEVDSVAGLAGLARGESIDHQRVEVTTHRDIDQTIGDFAFDTVSEFKPIASDTGRGLRDCVPQVVHGAGFVFTVGRVVPDLLDFVRLAFADCLRLDETVEQLATFDLRDVLASHSIETVTRTVEVFEAGIEGFASEVQREGIGVLLRQIHQTTERGGRSVEAHETHHSCFECDPKTAIETVLNREFEDDVILLNLQTLFAEGVDTTDTRTATRDDFLSLEDTEVTALEEFFNRTEEVFVLHHGVLFGHDSEALARVGADIATEAGLLAVGEQGRLLDLVVELARLVADFVFDFGDVHMRFATEYDPLGKTCRTTGSVSF